MARTADWERIDEPTARDKLFDQLTGKPAILPASVTDFEPEVLTLNGSPLDVDIRGSVTGGEIIRSIEGASTLTLNVSDDQRKLLRSGIFRPSADEGYELAALTVRLPGPKRDLVFSLAQLGKQGDELTLTFEDREIARLRRYAKPRKANRANTTRAEFIGMLAREARVRYRSPELHKVQPIGRVKKSSVKTTRTRETSEGGLPARGLTIKGAPISPAQRRNLEISLDVGTRLHAPRLAMLAMLVSGIGESSFIAQMNQGGSAYGGVFQGNVRDGVWEINDTAGMAASFFQGGKGFQGGGALSLAKAGGLSPGAIADKVEAGGAGAGFYDRHIGEARRILAAYGGDSGSEVTTTTTRTVVKPYFFQRGEGSKREDSWTAIKRLAEQVTWRAFIVEGTLWYVSEEDLFRAKPKMRISEDSPGVDWIDFDWDTGKKVSTVTVQCRVDAWTADPGSVIALKDSGPVDGKWLVESIRRGIWDAAAEITLRKPMKEKGEPAPESEQKTFGGEPGSFDSSSGGGGSGDAGAMVAWAKSKLGTAEGSAGQRRFAADLGMSAALPWCAIFISYGLKHIAHLPLPSNPAYSGAFLNWSAGRRVGLSDIQAGDIVIFDWGTGGMTDHVALYIGGGRVIGGNQSNNVTNVPLNRGAVVGVVRPKYRS